MSGRSLGRRPVGGAAKAWCTERASDQYSSPEDAAHRGERSSGVHRSFIPRGRPSHQPTFLRSTRTARDARRATRCDGRAHRGLLRAVRESRVALPRSASHRSDGGVREPARARNLACVDSHGVPRPRSSHPDFSAADGRTIYVGAADSASKSYRFLRNGAAAHSSLWSLWLHTRRVRALSRKIH